MSFLLNKFRRRKVVDRSESATELKRVLNTLDLTLLGIGSTLGLGIYVLAGAVAKEHAGPAVVISFFIAALASVLAGLCYAEFGARVPKAGSAYVYSYVCVGELIAFIVGWNLIMEYVIGVASVAKGYSGYVDSLSNGTMKDAFMSVTPLHVSFLSDHIDFFAFGMTLLVTCVLAFGVKESSLFNNIFTGLNLIVVTFVVIAGSFFATPSNWQIDVNSVNSTLIELETGHKPKLGTGGFAPFGFGGIMKGAATCFYGFVGFDCIATTGEEAKNPQKAIPLAIIFSLLFIFLAYFGISTVITMMVPYYLQDSQAPLPNAFVYADFLVGKWIVSGGAIFGLSTSLLGAMFPMPRVLYAMSSDGVLFKFLSKVSPRFQTPFIATIIAGTFGGVMAALFDLEALIDMMSIGTLTAYTLVAVCVLVLRYRKDEEGADDISVTGSPSGTSSLAKSMSSTWSDYAGLFYNQKSSPAPTKMSTSFSAIIVTLFCLFTIFFCAVTVFAEKQLFEGEAVYVILFAGSGAVLIAFLISLTMQPVSRVKLSFSVPLVPLIPGMSIIANVYLIMQLSGHTWIRFGVWMFVGFLIYGYCLLSGTTDKSYNQHMKEFLEGKRKYSKISCRGIDNPTLELSYNEKGDGGKMNGSGKRISATSIENKNARFPGSSSSGRPSSVSSENGNSIISKAVADRNPQQKLEDEDAETTKEIQDTLSALTERLDAVAAADEANPDTLAYGNNLNRPEIAKEVETVTKVQYSPESNEDKEPDTPSTSAEAAAALNSINLVNTRL